MSVKSVVLTRWLCLFGVLAGGGIARRMDEVRGAVYTMETRVK